MKKIYSLLLLTVFTMFFAGCYTQLAVADRTQSLDDNNYTQTNTNQESSDTTNIEPDEGKVVNNFYFESGFTGYRRYFRSYYPSYVVAYPSSIVVVDPWYYSSSFCWDPWYYSYHWNPCFSCNPYWNYNYLSYGWGGYHHGWNGNWNGNWNNNNNGIYKERSSSFTTIRNNIGTRNSYTVRGDIGTRTTLPPLKGGFASELRDKIDGGTNGGKGGSNDDRNPGGISKNPAKTGGIIDKEKGDIAKGNNTGRNDGNDFVKDVTPKKTIVTDADPKITRTGKENSTAIDNEKTKSTIEKSNKTAVDESSKKTTRSWDDSWNTDSKPTYNSKSNSRDNQAKDNTPVTKNSSTRNETKRDITKDDSRNSSNTTPKKDGNSSSGGNEVSKKETPKVDNDSRNKSNSNSGRNETSKKETPKVDNDSRNKSNSSSGRNETPRYETPKKETPRYETPKSDNSSNRRSNDSNSSRGNSGSYSSPSRGSNSSSSSSRSSSGSNNSSSSSSRGSSNRSGR